MAYIDIWYHSPLREEQRWERRSADDASAMAGNSLYIRVTSWIAECGTIDTVTDG